MKLPQSVIRQMKSLVYNSPVEICANLDESLEIDSESIVEGKEENSRGTCLFKSYTPVIFHTHPNHLYSYPSMEDVVKIIKNLRIINHSLIATKWGIWILSKYEEGPEQHTIYKTDLYKKIVNNSASDEEKIHFLKKEEKLKNFITSCLDSIGRKTSNKRPEGELPLDFERSVDYNEEKMANVLISVSKKFKESFPIKMTLYSWDELEDKISYIEL